MPDATATHEAELLQIAPELPESLLKPAAKLLAEGKCAVYDFYLTISREAPDRSRSFVARDKINQYNEAEYAASFGPGVYVIELRSSKNTASGTRGTHRLAIDAAAANRAGAKVASDITPPRLGMGGAPAGSSGAIDLGSLLMAQMKQTSDLMIAMMGRSAAGGNDLLATLLPIVLKRDPLADTLAAMSQLHGLAGKLAPTTAGDAAEPIDAETVLLTKLADALGPALPKLIDAASRPRPAAALGAQPAASPAISTSPKPAAAPSTPADLKLTQQGTPTVLEQLLSVLAIQQARGKTPKHAANVLAAMIDEDDEADWDEFDGLTADTLSQLIVEAVEPLKPHVAWVKATADELLKIATAGDPADERDQT